MRYNTLLPPITSPELRWLVVAVKFKTSSTSSPHHALRCPRQENWDASDCHYWVTSFLSKLHYLFNEEAAWQAPGYTRHILSVLENNCFAVVVDGDSKSFGGHPVPGDVKRRCMRQLQAWVVMVASILATEFPHHELLSSFVVFDLRVTTRTDLDADQGAGRDEALCRLARACGVSAQGLQAEVEDHFPVAKHLAVTQGLSNWESWRRAVGKTQSRPSTAERHPAGNLLPVLSRYGAMQCSTSGVEQLFSQVQLHMGRDRNHMTDDRAFAEVKLIADGKSIPDQKSFLQGARACWLAWYGQQRASPAAQRLDAGVPRKPKQDPCCLEDLRGRFPQQPLALRRSGHVGS